MHLLRHGVPWHLPRVFVMDAIKGLPQVTKVARDSAQSLSAQKAGREVAKAAPQPVVSEAVVVSLRGSAQAPNKPGAVRDYKEAHALARDIADRIKGDEHDKLTEESAQVLRMTSITRQ